jgi:hypothetical protein
MKQFLKEFGREEGGRLAKASGTTLAYLDQIAGGHRKPGFDLTKRLVQESGGRLSRIGLRPDVYDEAPAA